VHCRPSIDEKKSGEVKCKISFAHLAFASREGSNGFNDTLYRYWLDKRRGERR
jgi:hypothetical protein